MASQGFGKWFEDQQEGGGGGGGGGGGDSPWPQLGSLQLGSLWGGSSAEKKSDDGEDSCRDPESQGFLDSAQDWFVQVKTSTAEATKDESLFGLSYATRFKGFVATVLLAGFFFFMAFLVGLPVIVLRPSKFALCFTMGSLCYMSSFSLLKGPGAHVRSMLTLDRLPFTVAYVGSMLSTLYAALVARSYFLVVVASSVQLCALAYYMLSFLPGGTAGAKIFVAMFVKTVRLAANATITLFMGCAKMVSS